jgi:hypothetical protein
VKGEVNVYRASVKWLLVLLLVAGSAGGVTSGALATDHSHLGNYHAVSKLYFPFVPNNGMIGDTGPWHGSITVQNMGPEFIEVWALPDGRFDPGAALMQFQLLPHATRTISAEELGIAEPGSSLVLAAIYQDIWQMRDRERGLASMDAIGELSKPKIAATLKQSSPSPMENGVWTISSHTIVDGYSAIPMNDVGWGELSFECPSGDLTSCADIRGSDVVDGVSYLPLVQTNSDWNTILYVMNADGAIDGGSRVEVQMNPTDHSGNTVVVEDSMWLEPGEVWAIDLAEEVGLEWTGSVRFSSEAGTAAIAARHKSATDMMLINTSAPSRSDDGGSYRLSAPLVYVDFYGWNTGISLSNQADVWNQITISLYDDEGNLLETASQFLQAKGQGNFYLPSELEAEEDGWVGSAVLESESGEPFHAAVDQVNYVNGAAMSYTLGSQGADAVPGNQYLGLPLLQKSRSLRGHGDTSGIQLFNPAPDSSVRAELSVMALNASTTFEIEFDPFESYNFHVPAETDVPLGSVTSVIVTVLEGGGEIVAVSNLVNYDVRGDGALVFPLTNGAGQFR